MSFAPIILFAYNRAQHLQRTVRTLAKNKLASQSDLIVYLDGAKHDADAQQQQIILSFLRHVDGFNLVKVIHRDQNLGLADNIQLGVTEVINEYGRAIILEDDIIVSPYFLCFMNEALSFYRDKPEVWHVSGWNFPIDSKDLPPSFLWRTALGWGWGTWADRWQHYSREPQRLLNTWDQKTIQEFNLYGSYNFWEQVEKNASGELHTWAIFWYSTIFEHNGLCVNPVQAMTANIGFDGSGTHTGADELSKTFNHSLEYTPGRLPRLLEENKKVVSAIMAFNNKIAEQKYHNMVQNNHDLKGLLRVAVAPCDSWHLLTQTNVAIFGTAQLSQLLHDVFVARQVNVSAFLVSKPNDCGYLAGTPVLSESDWHRVEPAIIVTGIEGTHETKIIDKLSRAFSQAEVVSWRHLHTLVSNGSKKGTKHEQ